MGRPSRLLLSVVFAIFSILPVIAKGTGIEIRSSIDGLRVSVDGVAKGETQFSRLIDMSLLRVELEPGIYRVGFEFPGYSFDEVRLTVRSEGYTVHEILKANTLTVESLGSAVSLARPSTGVVLLRSNPSRALVVLDGKRIDGTTDMKLGGVPSGRRSIRVQLPAVDPVDVDLGLGPDARATVEVDFHTRKVKIEAPYVVTLRSTPAEARLFIDGIPMGPTPVTLALAAPRSELRLEIEGYRSISKRLDSASPVSEETIVLGLAPPELVFVEGGAFRRGTNEGNASEMPIHEVSVSSFWIGKYEVTQREYEDVMGVNPSEFKTGIDAARRPVDSVSWFDAVEYCNRRSESEGLRKVYSISGSDVRLIPGANGYRLPTEAEWEYAARGGIRTKGFRYPGSENHDLVAWWAGNIRTTTTVGTKGANELGLFDMAGNVGEWCWDWYGSYSATDKVDPLGADSGSRRVVRGGSWDSWITFLRSASRLGSDPASKLSHVGFRLARGPW